MTAVPFQKTSPPIAFDKALGLCFGWFAFSKKDGQPYVDAHGDHFPDDELLIAADELMARPASDRQINVDHAGAARGTIATVQALTEDVAKALRIDTGGTYGLVGSFRPDAELLKSITAGEMFCLSIEGSAADVETIAKSLDGATEHKRTMRKVSLTKLAVVKAGAHEGAAVALVKSARVVVRSVPVVKREPALTDLTNGHQHLIDDTEEPAGFTSYEMDPGMPGCGHSHPWVKDEATGLITIGAANGHSHTVTTDTEEPAMPDPAAVATVTKAEDLVAAKAACDKLMADVAELHAALGMAASMTPDEQAVAKGLSPVALVAWLKQPVEVRKAKSTPIYKAADGAVYFAHDDARLVAMAKSADAQTVELAKAKEQAEAVGFEKAATATIPNLKGTPQVKAAIMKSIAALPEADRVAVTETLKGADAAMAMLFKTQGHNVATDPATSLAAFDAGLATFAKAVGKPAEKVADEFLATPEGARLYADYDAERRASR